MNVLTVPSSIQVDAEGVAASLDSATASMPGASVTSALEILNEFAPVFAISFIVALLLTPVMRRLAQRFGIVDQPDAKRKIHTQSVAYLGGVAVAVALLMGLAFAYVGQTRFPPAGTEHYSTVPLAVIVGMIAILVTGLADDVFHWDPRLKIAGQLVAAAALVLASVGDDAALGMLSWLRHVSPEAFDALRGDGFLGMTYLSWIGVLIVAMFVLGGCNAANFLDGMDGLLSGVTAITACGLLVIAIVLIPFDDREIWSDQADAARVQSVLQREVADHRLEHGQAPGFDLVRVWAGPLDIPPGWELGYLQGVGRVLVRDQRETTAQSIEAALPAILVQSQGDLRPLRLALFGGKVGDKEVEPTHPLPAGYEVVIDGTAWPDMSLSVERTRSFGIARVVLCLALLGAVLGFLPHNFRPATIFLGDCGSLLLGYMCVVIILMMGDGGHSHLMFAGLIVFAVPIMDTILAIVRRKLAGVPVSVADNHHLHHQLQRTLGSVPRAVFALYGISAFFALVGVVLATGYVVFENRGVRLIYVIAGVLFSFVTVIAIKAARREQWRRQMTESAAMSVERRDESS